MFNNIIRLANIRDGSIAINFWIELSIPRKTLNAMLADFNGIIEGNQIIFTNEKDMLKFASKYFEYLANMI